MAAPVTRVSCRRGPVVAAVASLAVLGACGDRPGSTPPAAAARAAAVSIEARGCGPQPDVGSGALLGEGIVVTAAHVVAGAEQVVVRRSGVATPADVVLFDPDQDVAALRLDPIGDTSTSTTVFHGSVEPGAAGAVAVVADGIVTVRDVEVLRSVTIETTDIHLADDVRRPGHEIAATIEPGDSGALVHVDGGAIGIVWARSTRHDGRAWVVDLPRALGDPDRRNALVDAVDTGDCLP